MANYADSFMASTEVRHLTEREQKALLKITSYRKQDFRDHCFLAMAMATGLRIHELAALNVGDVFGPDGKIRMRVELHVYKGKNSKRSVWDKARAAKSKTRERQYVMIPMSIAPKLAKLVVNTLRDRPDSDAGTALFLNREGGRLSTRMMRHAFHEWQVRAGFDRLVNFHSLRHTACMNVYAATHDIRLVQKFARHRHLGSTQIYTNPSDDNLLDAVNKASLSLRGAGELMRRGFAPVIDEKERRPRVTKPSLEDFPATMPEELMKHADF